MEESRNGENSSTLTVDDAFMQVMSEKTCQSYGPKPTKHKIGIEAQLAQVTQERDQVVKEVKELKGQFDLQRVQQEEELAHIRVDMEAQNAK